MIDCDGVNQENNNPFVLESAISLNSDDGNVVCVFDLERSTPTNGDFYAVELSNDNNDNVIRLVRSTTANSIRLVVLEGGSTKTQNTFPYSGSDTFKVRVSKRNKWALFRKSGEDFEFLAENEQAGFEGTDWKFKVMVNNNSGQTISLDNFAMGRFDLGKTGLFMVQ